MVAGRLHHGGIKRPGKFPEREISRREYRALEGADGKVSVEIYR